MGLTLKFKQHLTVETGVLIALVLVAISFGYLAFSPTSLHEQANTGKALATVNEVQSSVRRKSEGSLAWNDAEGGGGLYGGDQILKGTTFTKYQQFIKNCFKILPRQALHAKSLSFDHPVTGKRLSFDSVLPDDMMQVIDKWRKYISGRDIVE